MPWIFVVPDQRGARGAQPLYLAVQLVGGYRRVEMHSVLGGLGLRKADQRLLDSGLQEADKLVME